MARIRTIKPEFWTSEQIMDCKPITRLLFIGLWNFVDDFGRAPVAPRTIKAQVMPGDNISGEEIQEMLGELRSSGLILFYSASGKDYFEITGWAKHQKIDNPSKYKVCPVPFSDETKVVAIPSEDLPKIGLEGKGRERNGKESIRSVATLPRAKDAFQRFKAAYPRRDGSNPWQPAEKKFRALEKSGVDPDVIIAGAIGLAREEAARGNIGTKFIPQAITWLNQQRYTDCAPETIGSEPSGFYAKPDSEQLEAWDQHNIASSRKRLPRDRNGGWRVAAEWPPGYVPRAEPINCDAALIVPILRAM